MPVQPNFIERIAFNTLNLAPGVMLDLAGLMAFQTLSTAARLGVFDTLEKQAMSSGSLAKQLGTHDQGTEMLLQALLATGYVQHKDNLYSNTTMTKKWLLQSDMFDLDASLMFWNAATRDLYPHAADVLKTNKRPYEFYEWVESDADLSQAFQKQLMSSAIIAGKEIAKKLKLPQTPLHVLDIGGGHGLYSIFLCQQYPQLTVTILDSHAAVETARENIAKYGMSKRIKIVEGDLWTTDWGKEHDVILLFNMIHHYSSERNVELLKLVKVALKSGGKIAILDQIAGKIPGSAAKAVIRLIALQFFLFAEGRIFEYDEVVTWFQQLGFANIQYDTFQMIPGISLIQAEEIAE